MQVPEQHVMLLSVEYPDGSQEWHCPTCGRRFILTWPPHYNRAILEEGDLDAVHTGEMDGMSSGYAVNSGMPDFSDDPYLAPFIEWIETRG